MVKSLADNSVTACLGAPGIGKSSLVISVAHFVHSRRMFPDGVFYVDLEGQKLSTVRYAIAQSIGMPAADTDEEVFAELGSKRCLLVLDKVEELLDEDEHKSQDLLGRLISTAPNIRLLLASRRIPHIPNVTAYSLSISELPLRTAVRCRSLSSFLSRVSTVLTPHCLCLCTWLDGAAVSRSAKLLEQARRALGEDLRLPPTRHSRRRPRTRERPDDCHARADDRVLGGARLCQQKEDSELPGRD